MIRADSSQPTQRRTIIIGVALALILMMVVGIGVIANRQPVTVKIAVSLPMWIEWYSQATKNTIELALQESNYRAGDRIVEVVYVDTSDPNDPDTVTSERAALEIALKDESIVAVWGSTNSAEAKNTIPYLNQVPITLMSAVATWPGLTKPGYAPGEPLIHYPSGRRNFFRVVPTDEIQGKVAARWIHQQGFRKIYIIRHNSIYSEGLAGILESHAVDFNLQIVGNELVEPSQMSEADFKALVGRVKEAAPSIVYYPGHLDKTFLVIEALRREMPDLVVLGGDGLTLETLPADTTLLEGVYATNVIPPIAKLESAAPLLKAYREAYGEPPPQNPDMILPAYESFRVLLKAIAIADSPTRIGVLRAMSELDTYNGAMGEWKFDVNGDTTLETINLLQLKHGMWVSVGVIK